MIYFIDFFSTFNSTINTNVYKAITYNSLFNSHNKEKRSDTYGKTEWQNERRPKE